MTEDLLVRLGKIFEKSKWMRFSLSYSRGQWLAVFSHENGKVYGKARNLSAKHAITEACDQTIENTRHLVGAEK